MCLTVIFMICVTGKLFVYFVQRKFSILFFLRILFFRLTLTITPKYQQQETEYVSLQEKSPFHELLCARNNAGTNFHGEVCQDPQFFGRFLTLSRWSPLIKTWHVTDFCERFFAAAKKGDHTNCQHDNTTPRVTF